MGYILPVNNDQYAQYANRTTQKDAPPMTLAKVYKPTLDKKFDEKVEDEKHKYEDQDEHKDEETTKGPLKLDDQTDAEIEAAEEIFHDLTGKGQNFDETV